MFRGDMTDLKGMQIAEAMGGGQRPAPRRPRPQVDEGLGDIWAMGRPRGIDLGPFEDKTIDLWGDQGPMLAGR
jgi:hypothetical protein